MHWSGLADFFAFSRIFCIGRDLRIFAFCAFSAVRDSRIFLLFYAFSALVGIHGFFCCTAFGDFSCACMGKIGLAIPEILRRRKGFRFVMMFFVKTFPVPYERNDPSPNGQLVLLSNFVLS